MSQVVTPVDPDSPEGQAVARDLTNALLTVKAAILRRRRLAEQAEGEREKAEPTAA